MPQGPEPQSRASAIFDHVSVILFATAWLALLGSLVAAVGPLAAVFWLGVCALPALLAADFAAGLLHWLADTFFTPDSPWVGPSVIRAFREHHVDPGAIARKGRVEVSGQNCFACLPLLALAAAAGVGGVTFVLAFTAAIAATNLFHQWAHADLGSGGVPAGVRALQRSGWILGAEHHALHHSGAHDCAYCVTTGWLNPLLDRVDFFGGLERAIRRLGPRTRRELAKGSRAQ